MDKQNSNIEFPMEQMEDELARNHSKFKDLLSISMTEMVKQNPQLFSHRVDNINSIKFNIELGRSSTKGVLLDYLQKLQQHVEEKICSTAATQTGRQISIDELSGVLTVPQSDYQILYDIVEDYKSQLVKNIQTNMLGMIIRSIPDTQQTPPDIEIGIVLRDVCGTRQVLYIESQGKVQKDLVIKLTSVTLDTNVLMEWWKERVKVEIVEELLKMGKEFEIDLAVTSRIRDDVLRPPLSERINELPCLDVQEIGSVIRIGHWNVGVDVVGDTEFRDFVDSNEVQQKIQYLMKMKRINNEPDWRDWDHVHTHYRYKRDFFLTWDKGILAFAEEFESRLGIQVLKPEDYLTKSKIHSPES